MIESVYKNLAFMMSNGTAALVNPGEGAVVARNGKIVTAQRGKGVSVHETFNSDMRPVGLAAFSLMALIISILILIAFMFIGKLLWNNYLVKNIQGVKPLNSWVELLGIYILVRIFFTR